MSKLKLPGAKDFTPITQPVLISRFHLGFVWTQSVLICLFLAGRLLGG